MFKNITFSHKIKRGFLVLSLLTALFIGVSYTPDYFEISKNLDIFNAIYRELNMTYVDGTKPGQLMKTGIDAMLASLDPYTVYFTENDIEDYRFMYTGEYGGIGATVLDMDGKIMITEPYEGFAAHKAGLRAGDQIVEINGINVKGKKTEEIGPLLKGTPGTTLTLKVLKPGQAETVILPIAREDIKTKAVPYFGLLPDGKTGYIKLSTFTEKCSDAVKNATNDLKAQGCKGLILDLRGNLGGLLQEAVHIVNLYVPKGNEIVFTKGKLPEWETRYVSERDPLDTQIPLTVLVDENSASASEIVCGALQDLDRAVIIGKRTYGKGLVQQTKPLVYNTQVKITVAKYYIPSGRCVQALDYSSRDEEGRVEKVPDSLTTAFKTKGGRIVYDGAGVMPDVKTPEQKFDDILNALINKNHIFNYATDYCLKHKDIGEARNFKLTEEEYSDFLAYLKNKDYSYKNQEELDLEEFKQDASEEGRFDLIKTEFEALSNKLAVNKKSDLEKNKSQIKKFLEEEIVSRYHFQKGRIDYGLKNDEDVAEAQKLLADSEKIKGILTTVDKPTRPFNPGKKF